jgi:hypothetical protein
LAEQKRNCGNHLEATALPWTLPRWLWGEAEPADNQTLTGGAPLRSVIIPEGVEMELVAAMTHARLGWDRKWQALYLLMAFLTLVFQFMCGHHNVLRTAA